MNKKLLPWLFAFILGCGIVKGNAGEAKQASQIRATYNSNDRYGVGLDSKLYIYKNWHLFPSLDYVYEENN